MTVATLFHDWHVHHAMLHCTPAWQQDSMYQFRLRIEPLFRHRRIDDVNPELTEEPQRQVTAWPLEVVDLVALTARRLPEELPEFQRSQQAEWIGERHYALIKLAALAGLRQSEILGLRWEQIDQGWIHVTHKLCRRSFTRRETKSKRGTRRVPLAGQAAQILEDWRAIGAHAEIVFPNQTGDDHQRAEHFANDASTKARHATSIVRHKGVAHNTRTTTTRTRRMRMAQPQDRRTRAQPHRLRPHQLTRINHLDQHGDEAALGAAAVDHDRGRESLRPGAGRHLRRERERSGRAGASGLHAQLRAGEQLVSP